MQVQEVGLVGGHQVDQAEQVGFLREIAAHVKHQAAPGQVGPVADHGSGHRRALRVAADALQRGAGVAGAVFVGRLDADGAVREGDAVPAGALSVDQGDGRLGGRVGLARERLHLLEAGNEIIDAGLHVRVAEALDGLGGQETVFRLHGDGLAALALQEEAFRGAALVDQGLCFVVQDHRLSARVRAGNDAIQRPADVLDAARRALLHGDGGAELAEPDGPVRTGGRVLDFEGVGGPSGSGIRDAFRPDNAARLGARYAKRVREKEEKIMLSAHNQRVLFAIQI